MIAGTLVVLLALALPVAAGERLAGRAQVTDGDTVSVAGIHVRLKGVAAPEVAHAGEAGEPGGEAAKAFVRARRWSATSPASALVGAVWAPATAAGWTWPRR